MGSLAKEQLTVVRPTAPMNLLLATSKFFWDTGVVSISSFRDWARPVIIMCSSDPESGRELMVVSRIFNGSSKFCRDIWVSHEGVVDGGAPLPTLSPSGKENGEGERKEGCVGRQ